MSSSPSQFTFTAAGDSIITRKVLPIAARDDRFRELCTILQSGDAALTNLEVVLPERDAYATTLPPVPDQYQYLSPLAGILMRAEPFVLDELAGMGFNLFSAASNHSFDYGRAGICSTMTELEARQLTFAGLGRTLADARRPSYRDTEAGRVGLVSANTSIAPGSEAGEASAIHPGRPGINPLHLRWIYGATDEQIDRLQALSEELGIESMKSTWLVRDEPDWESKDWFRFMHMAFESVTESDKTGVRHAVYEPDRDAYLKQIEDATKNADWVVATLHSHQGPGGVRNVPETPQFLPTFAKSCIDRGADAFVGTGPHVLRGMEIYKNRPIFYSLGNFFYQTETIDRLPKESFDYYGVTDSTDVTALFDSRYYDDAGNPSGGLLNEGYWESIVPRCTFADGELDSVELYPCTLGRSRDRPQRGTPKLASGNKADRILKQFSALSAPFGTTFDRKKDRLVVNL